MQAGSIEMVKLLAKVLISFVQVKNTLVFIAKLLLDFNTVLLYLDVSPSFFFFP